MLQTRRSILHAIRQTTRTYQRRYESSTGHTSSAGKVVESPHPPHPHSANQSFGRGFYLTIAVIPLFYAIHQYSFSDEQNPPFFTRLIDEYSNFHERWAERNEIHTRMLEVAARDKNLFGNERMAVMRQLDFPEIFNTGSPYNVPAGSSINMDALIAHYEKLNKETDERRVARNKRWEAIEKAEAERKANGSDKKGPPADRSWF